MRYETLEDRRYPGEWRVEAIDTDGSCYVTLFSGPQAKERAYEYAEWKQSARRSSIRSFHIDVIDARLRP